MSDRIAVALPDGRWLAMSAEVFAEALAAGARMIGAPAGSAAATDDEPLLDAEQLAEVLGVPATRIEALARQRAIPAIRVGRYWRFSRREVEKALKAPAGARLPAGPDLRTTDAPNHEAAYGRRNHNVRPRITPAG